MLLRSKIARAVSLATRHRSKVTLIEDAFGIPPPLQVRRVVVTGLGLVTPLGVGVERAWQALLQGSCGIKRLSPEDLPKGHDVALGNLPSQVAAVVPGEQLAQALSAASLSAKGARFVNFADLAGLEALQDAEWAPFSEAERQASGVSIGSGLSCTSELAEAGSFVLQGLVRKISPFLVTRILANSPAGAVSMRHKLKGPSRAAATACAAGADAIGEAFHLIRGGHADVMVAGGTEACVDAVALAAFGRMNALSSRYNAEPGKASRPFDEGRCGFVLGEGAAVLVLEELGHAIARGAPQIYAELRGYGSSADAHHITQPPEDGRGAVLAMQRALESAGAAPSQVTYINAHGTATPLGDVAELRAIQGVFASSGPAQNPAQQHHTAAGRIPKVLDHILHGHREDEAAREALPHISSTKGATGHLLGAAGAMEAAFTVLTLRDNVAPHTLNLEKPIPGPWEDALIRQRPRKLPLQQKMAMSNSFGFGGVNASLLFASPPMYEDPIVDGTP
ncbi:hypothetical protein CVIRNUC_001210 [Coccomyxa viridis]|uniref:beta-ketoacyl-[acyl-carrier-protein] synthase I n=1 Tax=Coccomyxa viridis TaxID=1274662 RepID=A0AAV1HTS5_9CHLO|nr:hypothetical protein CVIRNUC_001210 [Coccomyxa viridis]